MSDAVQLALISALPPTLMALAAFIVSWRTSAKTDVVIGHVNSAATQAAGEIRALRHEVALMREAAGERKQEAALLAQAAVQRKPELPPEPPPADGTIHEIKKTTAETKTIVKAIDKKVS